MWHKFIYGKCALTRTHHSEWRTLRDRVVTLVGCWLVTFVNGASLAGIEKHLEIQRYFFKHPAWPQPGIWAFPPIWLPRVVNCANITEVWTLAIYTSLFSIKLVCTVDIRRLNKIYNYSATYMSQTRDQQRFTISNIAADWHAQMVPQCIVWPSIARANGQLDPRCR